MTWEERLAERLPAERVGNWEMDAEDWRCSGALTWYLEGKDKHRNSVNLQITTWSGELWCWEWNLTTGDFHGNSFETLAEAHESAMIAGARLGVRACWPWKEKVKEIDRHRIEWGVWS